MKSRQVTKLVTPVYDSEKKNILARIKIKVRSRSSITIPNNIKNCTEKIVSQLLTDALLPLTKLGQQPFLCMKPENTAAITLGSILV